MIINKDITTTWNPTTKDHYISKGYVFTKYRDKLKVNTKDLVDNSNEIVEVLCTYCNNTYNRKHRNVIISIRNSIVGKWACQSCNQIKIQEERKIRQEKGLIKPEDSDYLIYEENVLIELDRHIKYQGSIQGLHIENAKLYSAIYRNKSLNMTDLIEKLGYNWGDVSSEKPRNLYKDFNLLEEEIKAFIKDNNRFPNTYDMTKTINVDGRTIQYHGGMDEIKRKISYSDTCDLIDDRGFLNSSYLEFLVAQYLICNNVQYKREVLPFKDSSHRSDFYIETEDGDSVHIEVWGYSKNGKGSREIGYNRSRALKESKYKNNNIKLISLEYDEMNGKPYSEIQEYLKKELRSLEDMILKDVDTKSFIHAGLLTDKEMLDVFMKYSDDDCLPTQEILQENNLNKYLIEIRKRYTEGYYGFAKAMGKELSGYKYIWNKESLYVELFNFVSNTKLPISKKNMIESGLHGMLNFSRIYYDRGGYTPIKLDFYSKYIKENDYIHPYDLEFLSRLANRSEPSARYLEEDIKTAKEILEVINNK